MKYPIAPNGIFTTIQGEGTYVGEPMVFIRLAGCSVGCPLCDTDYRVDRRLSVEEIVHEVQQQRKLTYTSAIWITGGEPMDHDLGPLLGGLRLVSNSLYLATSGHMEVPDSYQYRFGCRLSVSPHDPAKWKQFTGAELKIVPGLAGYGIADFMAVLNSRLHGFGDKFMCPCAGKPETVQECRDFVMANLGWKMGGQLHKQWGLP